jgi:uncharacterized coiled-coil protein SlyX
MAGEIMRSKKCFIVVVTLAACLFGLHTTLLGQEPNDIEELKTIIAKMEKQIEQQEKKIKRLREELRAGKEELQAEKDENKRLIKICREAGINVEKTESPMKVDYEVCQTPIKPAILSDSMKTLGFTKLEVGELGWIGSLDIKQVIDANNAIVAIPLYRSDGSIAERYTGPYYTGPAMETPKFMSSEAYAAMTKVPGVPIEETVWLKGVQKMGLLMIHRKLLIIILLSQAQKLMILPWVVIRHCMLLNL